MSGGRLYSRRLTAPSGLRVEPAAGLTPWAGRVLPVIGFALQAGSGLAPSGVIKHRCAGERKAPCGRHFVCRFAAVRLSPPAGGMYTGAAGAVPRQRSGII